MELYFMAFFPKHDLKAAHIYLDEWNGYASPKDYLDNLNQPRYFVGFSFGGF
jgi:hypothetical protein